MKSWFFKGTHVLKKTWVDIPLIKPPKVRRIPDIVTIDEAIQLFVTTRKLSYRVLFFTLYSMGLRLGEGLRLQTGDIDAARISGCIFVMRKETKIVWCFYRRKLYKFYGVSGVYINTPLLFFPTVNAA